MLAFSAAIAVKLQALLLAPLLVLLWLSGRQPARTVALIPLAYGLFALPMALAGRPLEEIFGVYYQQAGTFAALCKGAPNIWAFGQMLVSYQRGMAIGLPAAAAVTGAAILLLWRARSLRTPSGLLLAAAILLVVVAYFTPKMHDRYFYLVDPVMVALVCRNHRFLVPMLLAQAASIFAYLPFILDGYVARDALWGYTGWIAQTTGVNYAMLPLPGALAMGAALVLLVGAAWRRAAWGRIPTEADPADDPAGSLDREAIDRLS
ncbi:hypothetical protein DBR17_18390 [Sphingomonas sp. HMWF008]|nr:hypothetical protein DBR17_18390 [Sphingomonas sp. HMWF008]